MFNGNGKVIVSWVQLVWGMGVLWFAAGAWWDIQMLKEHVRTGIYTKAEVDLRIVSAENRLWSFLVRGAQATEKR